MTIVAPPAVRARLQNREELWESHINMVGFEFAVEDDKTTTTTTTETTDERRLRNADVPPTLPLLLPLRDDEGSMDHAQRKRRPMPATTIVTTTRAISRHMRRIIKRSPQHAY
jgi:hypothetical protein